MTEVRTYEFIQHGVPMKAVNRDDDVFVDITLEVVGSDPLFFDVITLDPAGFEKEEQWLRIWVDAWRVNARSSAKRLDEWCRRFDVPITVEPDPVRNGVQPREAPPCLDDSDEDLVGGIVVPPFQGDPDRV